MPFLLGILAVVAFILALVFHIAGGNVNQYWVDAMLAGFVLWALAALLSWPNPPWARRQQ